MCRLLDKLKLVEERLINDTIIELEEELLDLQTKIFSDLLYSDMPMGSGGKMSSQHEKRYFRRLDLIDKLDKLYKVTPSQKKKYSFSTDDLSFTEVK